MSIATRKLGFLATALMAWALACSASAETALAAGFSTVRHASTPLGAKSGSRMHRWVLKRDGEDGSTIEVVAILMPARGGSVTVAPLGRQGAGRALFRSGVCPKGAVAANGGFYVRDERGARPLGLLRAKGATLSAATGRKFGGFFTSDGTTPAIVRRSEPEKALAARYAVESSPIVVEHGRVGIRTDNGERFDRVGVGVTRSGATIVAGVFGADQDAVTLMEFARIAIGAARALNELPDDVLAMDGGSSAHIYVPGSDTFFGWDGPAYVPNVVCLQVR